MTQGPKGLNLQPKNQPSKKPPLKSLLIYINPNLTLENKLNLVIILILFLVNPDI